MKFYIIIETILKYIFIKKGKLLKFFENFIFFLLRIK